MFWGIAGRPPCRCSSLTSSHAGPRLLRSVGSADDQLPPARIPRTCRRNGIRSDTSPPLEPTDRLPTVLLSSTEYRSTPVRGPRSRRTSAPDTDHHHSPPGPRARPAPATTAPAPQARAFGVNPRGPPQPTKVTSAMETQTQIPTPSQPQAQSMELTQLKGKTM